MTVSIGPRIGVEGVKQFRQAFIEITNEAKRFDAEMKRITATFSTNDSAMTRNRKIREQLTKQIEHQKGVVKVASDTYEEAVKAETRAAENYEKAQERAQKKVAELTDEKKKLERQVNKEFDAYIKQETHIELLQKDYDKAAENVAFYSDKLGKSHPYVVQLTKALDDQGKELDEEKAKLKQQETAVNSAAKAVRENEAEQRKANKTVEDASNTLYRASSRVDKYGTDVENAKIKLAEYEEQLRQVPSSLETVGKYMTDFGSTVEGIGDKLSTYITAPLTALGTYGVKNASNLADGMAKVYTIATETQEPMAEMKQGLIDLSDATGFALDDLTEAAYQSVSASVDAGKAVEFLGDATKLARAGFTSTTKSVDLLTTIINAYGYEVEDAAQISDVLLKTQNDGKTIIDELADSMGIVVPTAAAYHVSLEQLSAAYATMTKQGVKTSRATTFINALFTELENSSKDVAKILQAETGRSFAQLMDDGWSLGQVLQVLYENVDQDSEAFANLFKNVRSGRAANALMADDLGILNDEIERMGDATGQTDYALQMLETPSLKARRALNKLKNSTVDLGETLIDQFYPVFEKLTDVVTDFRDWIKNLSDEEKKNIVRTGELIALAGPLLKYGGKVITGVGKTIGLFSKLSKATEGATSAGKAFTAIIDAEGLGFGALAQATGIAVGAYVALGAAAKFSYDTYRESIVSANSLNDAQKELVQSATELNTSTREMSDASKEEAENISKNADNARTLVERYNGLVEQTGLATESQQAMADVYLGQLASALGMEKDQIKALIDENGFLKDSIYEVIDAKKANAILSTYDDDYANAVKSRIEAQKEVRRLTKQQSEEEEALAKATENLTYWQNKANEESKTGLGISDATQKALDAAVIAHSAANTAYEETTTGLNNANEALLRINTTITNYEGLQAAVMTGSAEEIALAIDKITTEFISAKDGSKEALEQQVKDTRSAWLDIKREYEKGTAGITKEQVQQLERLAIAAQKELDNYGNIVTTSISDTDRKVLQDMYNHYKPLKDASARNKEAMMSGIDGFKKEAPKSVEAGGTGMVNTLHAKIEPVKTETTNIKNAALAGLDKEGLRTEMEATGKYATEGFVKGLKSVPVEPPAKDIGKRAVDALNGRVQVSSPSKVTEETGKFFSEGFAIGIQKETSLVRQASEKMAQSAVDSSWMMNHYTPTGLGYTAGGMTSNTRNITAPISVNVNVNGNVDDVDQLAEVIADRINSQIIRQNEVFA